MPGVIWAAGLRNDLEDGPEITHESGRLWMHVNIMKHNVLHTFSGVDRTGLPRKISARWQNAPRGPIGLAEALRFILADRAGRLRITGARARPRSCPLRVAQGDSHRLPGFVR
jgi:hypothetical protein